MKTNFGKRSLVFLLLLLVSLSGIAVAEVLTNRMISGNATAIKGAANVSYPISLENNETVVGFQAVVDYNISYLTFKSVQPTGRMSNATIVVNHEPTLLKIAALVNGTDDAISPGSGPIINIIFDVSSSALEGGYVVDLSDIVASNIETQSLPTPAIDGLFSIVQPYNFTFLPPIVNEEFFTLQEGATLPLKFNVTDGTNFVNDTSVEVVVFNSSFGFRKEYNASESGDDYIRIEDNENYIVTKHTGQLGMQPGFYDIVVRFNNYQEEEIGFELINSTVGKGKKK